MLRAYYSHNSASAAFRFLSANRVGVKLTVELNRMKTQQDLNVFVQLLEYQI